MTCIVWMQQLQNWTKFFLSFWLINWPNSMTASGFLTRYNDYFSKSIFLLFWHANGTEKFLLQKTIQTLKNWAAKVTKLQNSKASFSRFFFRGDKLGGQNFCGFSTGFPLFATVHSQPDILTPIEKHQCLKCDSDGHLLSLVVNRKTTGKKFHLALKKT